MEEVAVPRASIDGEAVIKVLRAGICSTDLEITRGYVPGYDHTLGHEFVGRVVDAPGEPSLVGSRVVGEINCPCEPCTHPDPVFVRNHAPVRTVLGIIGKDGTMAEFCTLPVANLHSVPDDVSDAEACFAEPLAAACRIVEQHAIQPGDAVAVIGDGKLGILIAHVLASQGFSIAFFGRHERKLALVPAAARRVVVTAATASEEAAAFDVVVEASGSPQGIQLALALTRPLGTLVLKSTCSTATEASAAATWGAIANDVVVNEKRIVGSRCGPFPPAMELLRDAATKRLVNAMVDAAVPLADGAAAMEAAGRKGALKVQLVMASE